MNRNLVILLLMLGVVAGCKTGPDYRRPDVVTPADWRTGGPVTNTVAGLVWTDLYRDPVLTNLISTALANNKDLRVAVARVDEALATYHIQRSALFPAVNVAGDYTSARIGNIAPAPGAEAHQYNLFGQVSYEIDFWGRVRRLKESAFAQALATEEGRRTVQIGLIAGVASTYFNLRALDRQLEIADDTYVSRTNTLELARVRFDNGNGIVSELDVAQAETQVASAQSAMASLERQVALTEHALSLLLGSNPRSIPRGQALDAQWQPGELPAGLPSDLLLHRPDIRAAEQQLIAANANIGAARAAYFPVISLTGALGLQSEALGDLFDAGLSKAWSFTPSLTAPIFNAGRIRAGVQVAEARRNAALASYESTIQNAFREVDDALVSIACIRKQRVADESVLRAERRRFDLSLLRYEGGVASYSDVLDAQRSLFNAELTVVQTRNALLSAVVQLYKALGGGW